MSRLSGSRFNLPHSRGSCLRRLKRGCRAFLFSHAHRVPPELKQFGLLVQYVPAQLVDLLLQLLAAFEDTEVVLLEEPLLEVPHFGHECRKGFECRRSLRHHGCLTSFDGSTVVRLQMDNSP